jgi:hypothetical protein
MHGPIPTTSTGCIRVSGAYPPLSPSPITER